MRAATEDDSTPTRANVIGCTGTAGAAGTSVGMAGASGGTPDASAGDAGQTGAAGSDASVGPRDSRADSSFVPDPPYVAPAHQGNLIHVRNHCSFPLWLHGVGGGGTLAPDNLMLAGGATHDYTINDWPFAWVTAYLDGPQQNMIDRAELTLFPTGLVTYRLGYIDGIGLPMELQAIGQGNDCKPVGCYVPEAQIVAECPPGLLAGKLCRSPGVFCADPANAAMPYCHALDASISTCAASVPGCAEAASATTANVYACTQVFGDNPGLCAALNRGMVSAPTSTDDGAFYRTGPYNSYAAWMHDICPGIYAFTYDDVQTSANPFHACSNSTQLNITFCPAG